MSEKEPLHLKEVPKLGMPPVLEKSVGKKKERETPQNKCPQVTLEPRCFLPFLDTCCGLTLGGMPMGCGTREIW